MRVRTSFGSSCPCVPLSRRDLETEPASDFVVTTRQKEESSINGKTKPVQRSLNRKGCYVTQVDNIIVQRTKTGG